MYSAKKEWANLVESYRRLDETSEIEKIRTWESLRVLFTILLKKKDMEKIAKGGDALGKLAKNAISTMTGMDTVKAIWTAAGQFKEIKGLVQTAYKLNDEKAEKSPFLDSLNVDDGYSEILDDRLEAEFLDWFVNKYLPMKEGPIKEEEDNINKVLEEFLRERGEGQETVTDAESSAKFTDLTIPSNIGKKKKLGSFVRGLLNGLF